MTEPVKLYYANFMSGLLPKDGDRIDKNDLVLNGTDGTAIIIKQSGNTVYKEVPIKVFEAIPENSTLYKFIFPADTISTVNGSIYTTPSNSVYTFNAGYTAHKDRDNWIVLVSSGTIQIKPPDTYGPAIKETTEFISNAATNAASLSDPYFVSMKENPFYNMGLLIYLVFRDMLVVMIFWMLFISISCWIEVRSNYLYPTDPTTYPFIFYKSVSDGGKYYDYLTPDDEEICKKKTDSAVTNYRKKQTDLFKEIDDFQIKHKDESDILKSIYPQFQNREAESINTFSGSLTSTCSDPELDTAKQLRYVMTMLLLQNYLYCNQITSMIHGFVHDVKEMLGELDKRLLVVLFSGLLYGFFSSSSVLKDNVIQTFQIKFMEEIDMNSMITNQVILFLVYILAACMCIFTPMFSVLAITCLAATTYVLVKNILIPFNNTIWIFSLATIILSLGSYLSFSLMLGGVINPKDMVSFNDASSTSLFIFIFSLVGVGLPIFSALGYAGHLSLKLFISFFSFLKMPAVQERMKDSIPSLVMVALLLLLIHVNELLGMTYSFITATIIFLIGVYIWLTKK